MENRPDLDDDDDDFSDIYKAYTGPLGSSVANTQEKPQSNKKRSQAGSDEEEERDPNAVPTDFTSREARVWEAKSKATERNWKKRKEEEMICKICGESGHFTQGCPTTLGGKRNAQDFFERVAARDKHVRALFTDKVRETIEKDNGCKIRMDEKFIIVSGKDRLVLRKGVDAVHRVIRGEDDDRVSPTSHRGRSRSPERSPVGGARFSRSEPQKSNPSPRNSSQFQRFARHDKGFEDRIRGDLQKASRNSPQAYGSDGGKGRASQSRSPARVSYSDGGKGRASQSRSPARVSYRCSSYNTYETHRQGVGAYRTDGWETERHGSGFLADSRVDHSSVPPTLEDLEMEYHREAMDLARLRDQQLDEENRKHHELSRDVRETYMKRLADLQSSHSKQWEKFLHLDAQRCQQQVQRQKMPATGFGSYQPSSFPDYGSLGKQPYPESDFHREPRGQYAHASENYSLPRPPRDTFNDFQHQKVERYGRAYSPY